MSDASRTADQALTREEYAALHTLPHDDGESSISAAGAGLDEAVLWGLRARGLAACASHWSPPLWWRTEAGSAALEATEFLRLDGGDIPLLWGILDRFRLCRATTQPWPRFERIVADVEAMMERKEERSGG